MPSANRSGGEWSRSLIGNVATRRVKLKRMEYRAFHFHSDQLEKTMHYEINVTKMINGRERHWFATHERSVRDEATAKEVADALRCLPDAASVTVTRWETSGQRTDI